ncbi:unnamed protein product [Moneuplotes crassus]|uniref:Uncharacterized protein n=1 Tax=Euplotes crassus TaxID=5936 RepID=A0AAD1U8Y1_EUPCR|nr:unnamed protein product [Moneuplotes crassus]
MVVKLRNLFCLKEFTFVAGDSKAQLCLYQEYRCCLLLCLRKRRCSLLNNDVCFKM